MQKKIPLILIVYFLTSPLGVFAWDWGNSNNFYFKKPLDEKWTIESRSLFTSKQDMGDVFFGVVDLGLSYKTLDWLTIGASYRGAWFEQSKGWGYESRPLINILAKTKWKDTFLSNRSRFEFRNYQYNKKDDVRYRNETRLIAPYQFTSLKLQPFFEEEFFYSYNTTQIDMNWVTGGLMYQVNKNTRLKCGYRWHAQKLSGKWFNRHVLVTGLMMQF